MTKYIPVICLIVLAVCIFLETVDLSSITTTPTIPKHITVVQDDKETIITEDHQKVYVNKREFAIRFFHKKYDTINNKSYNAKLSAFLDKRYLYQAETDLAVEYIPFFKPGTGMAARRKQGYDCLYFNNRANHYLFYKTEDDKRLYLLDEVDGYAHFEFPINQFFIDKKRQAIKSVPFSEFFIILFIDKNLNEIIDEGELTKLTIAFKD